MKQLFVSVFVNVKQGLDQAPTTPPLCSRMSPHAKISPPFFHFQSTGHRKNRYIFDKRSFKDIKIVLQQAADQLIYCLIKQLNVLLYLRSGFIMSVPVCPSRLHLIALGPIYPCRRLLTSHRFSTVLHCRASLMNACTAATGRRYPPRFALLLCN